jgi:hypothetical protein
MAAVLFVVKASITPEREEAFNRWYNEEHCPQLLRFRGAVSARRYKAIMGEEKYQYMAVYEFESEPTFPAVSRVRASRRAEARVRRPLRGGLGARPLRLRPGVAVMRMPAGVAGARRPKVAWVNRPAS